MTIGTNYIFMEDNYEVFDDFKPTKADDGISTFVKEKIEKEKS